MAHPDPAWTEEDSRTYRLLANIAVPSRDEQIATLLLLLPFARDHAFRVVELGCGEGSFAQALLSAFPHASLLALDGSGSMREAASARLTPFAERARVEPFDLPADAWLPHLDAADAVVSTLAVHHLNGDGKQRLFAQVARRLAPAGALLIADIVEAGNETVHALYAGVYDHVAKTQSAVLTGSDEAYRAFVDQRWNCYRNLAPGDLPSPLFDQLLWLREAGFAVVDSFWQKCGHAIYGGYLPAGSDPPARSLANSPRLSFAQALALARAALGRDAGS